MGVYNILFYGGLILAILFLIASVVLFFVLKIPKVFGELTGRTERKSIEEIKKSGYESKSKQEAIHEKTGRITVRDAAADSDTGTLKKKSGKNMSKNTSKYSSTMKPTEVLDEEQSKKQVSATAILDEETTDVLSNSKYDKVDEESTDVLASGNDEESTDVLTSRGEEDEDGSTDVLTSEIEDEDGSTDVLTSEMEDEDGSTDVLTSEMEDEDGSTDVLTSKEIKENDNISEYGDQPDILGRYSAEETGVLRSIHTRPSENNSELRKNAIKVIYQVTVVHTEEVL